MTFQGAVGADPDALGRLALALERMGDEIDQRRAVARVALTRSGASAPSVDQRHPSHRSAMIDFVTHPFEGHGQAAQGFGIGAHRSLERHCMKYYEIS